MNREPSAPSPSTATEIYSPPPPPAAPVANFPAAPPVSIPLIQPTRAICPPPISPPAKPFTFLANELTPPAASSCSTATAIPASPSTPPAWPTATSPPTAPSSPPSSLALLPPSHVAASSSRQLSSSCSCGFLIRNAHTTRLFLRRVRNRLIAKEL